MQSADPAESPSRCGHPPYAAVNSCWQRQRGTSDDSANHHDDAAAVPHRGDRMPPLGRRRCLNECGSDHCFLALAVTMPSPWRTARCAECGREWQTRSLTARACSPKCRAVLREREKPGVGRAPRDYPTEVVERVRSLYESGMTRTEVQEAIGVGVKVENVMRRYGIAARPAIPRDQTGERNATWRGDQAGYQALHLRVESARGKPSHCERCGTSDLSTRYEWANLTGNYTDVTDYERMCVTCHRRFDAERRERTGARTSPVRR